MEIVRLNSLIHTHAAHAWNSIMLVKRLSQTVIKDHRLVVDHNVLLVIDIKPRPYYLAFPRPPLSPSGEKILSWKVIVDLPFVIT